MAILIPVVNTDVAPSEELFTVVKEADNLINYIEAKSELTEQQTYRLAKLRKQRDRYMTAIKLLQNHGL